MKIKGIGIGDGKSIGTVLKLQLDKNINIDEKSTENKDDVVLEFKKSLNELIEELEETAKKLRNANEEIRAEMFEMHKELLDDPEYMDGVLDNIEAGYSAQASVARTTNMQSQILSSMGNDFMAERAKDIEDVGNRLLCKLRNETYFTLDSLESPCVVVADDIPPSIINGADKNMVIGIIMAKGSKTSHVSILATNMEIPTIVGCKNVDSLENGDYVYLDAEQNFFQTDIENDEKLRLHEIVENYKDKTLRLKSYKNFEAKTRDLTRINVYGNIMDIESAEKTVENGGDGVGLFRTEFLYMNRTKLPSEEEQYSIYSSIAKK